jgi:hypothetical protein
MSQILALQELPVAADTDGDARWSSISFFFCH